VAPVALRQGEVHAVVVGADRIARNGDTANKIGTYGLAVQAHQHKVPFYVAAPSTTFDLSLASGDGIPIEQRAPEEVTAAFGKVTAPEGVSVYNPAFDVTPARLVTAFITEHGVILLKFWVHISAEEQLRRFEERERTPWKQHKITHEDWRNRERWSDYEAAVNEMVARTSTVAAPWTIVPGEDKRYGRVAVLEAFRDRLRAELA